MILIFNTMKEKMLSDIWHTFCGYEYRKEGAYSFENTIRMYGWDIVFMSLYNLDEFEAKEGVSKDAAYMYYLCLLELYKKKVENGEVLPHAKF